MKLKSTILFFLIMSSLSLMGQVTTAGMTGKVVDGSGNAVLGATVRLTHTPSGTVYGTITDENGNYSILNARPGGPYTVEVSAVGSNTYVENNLYLNLGDVLGDNITLDESSLQLNELLVVGERNPVINGDRTGAATNISNQAIQRLPTLSRSISDFTRLTPQANGNGFAGRDGRYNNLQIDGANFNNAFGLSSEPLPGGGNQPISLDAIEQIQVNIAPYDVRQTGFTGAGINAVTRSGTNEVHGSAYAYLRPKSFTGLKVDDYSLSENARANSSIYGARLSGPIIKNKLLYFVNFEYENTEQAGNLWIADDGTNSGKPNVSRTTVADLERVSAHLKSKYGYDPGAYQGYDNVYNNKNLKGLARLDWNINEKNNFNIRYSYMQGTNDQGTNASSGPNPRSSTSRISDKSIAFENANYALSNKVSSIAAELNSRFTSKMSNQLIATYSRIQDTRSTPGSLFPFVDIGDGSGGSTFSNYMSFGTELFSYNNELINKNLIVTDNLTYVMGKNTFTAGVSYQSMYFGNSYQRLGSSYYRYNSVDDFVNDAAPIAYGVTYVLNGQDRLAKVNFGLAGLYLQDKIALTDRLNVTLGIRGDVTLFNDNPPANPVVDTLNFLDPNGKPINYTTSKWPKSVPLYSPRLGFNLDVLGNKTLQLRGGTGIFTGNIPFVWFTNMPTNAGVIQNTYEPVSSSVLGKIDHFEKDPEYWVNQLPSDFPRTPSSKAPGGLSLIDPDFKMPQVWRSNVGLDVKIPGTPLVVSTDFIYTKDLVGVYQYNTNRKPATEKLNYSGDTRDYWGGSKNTPYNTIPGVNSVVPVLSNQDQGYSMAASISLSIANYKGINAGVFYNYSNAEDVSGNPGSAAGSAWSNNYSVNDPNEQLLGYSQFAVPHRIGANLSYRMDHGSMFATTIGLYYNGTNPGRFAYTYNGDINADGVNNDLLYIPNSASELTFAPLKVGDRTFTPEEQSAAFDAFVSSIPALNDARGGYVKRNSGLLPWRNRVDLKIMVDINFKVNAGRTHTIQLSFDVINVGNLINSKWGISQELDYGSFYNYGLLKVADNKTNVPKFNMNVANGQLATTPFRNSNSVYSTWAAQFGVRYIF